MDVKLIILLCSLFFVILTIGILFLSRKKGENYSYNYTKLTKEEVDQILKKECNLTLRDYINILNSTDNLRLLSLQQLSNNFICSELTIKDSNELMSFLNTISGNCILKCIKNKDWYRIALTNLKINQLMNLLQNSKISYKRSLTNGVYSAEYINMYYEDKQLNMGELVQLYIENYKNIKITNKEFEKYSNEILPILSKMSDSNDLDINPVEFAMISTLSLVNIYDFPLIDC